MILFALVRSYLLNFLVEHEAGHTICVRVMFADATAWIIDYVYVYMLTTLTIHLWFSGFLVNMIHLTYDHFNPPNWVLSDSITYGLCRQPLERAKRWYRFNCTSRFLIKSRPSRWYTSLCNYSSNQSDHLQLTCDCEVRLHFAFNFFILCSLWCTLTE